MGSLEHPLSSMSIEGSVKADGESSKRSTRNDYYAMNNGSNVDPGGGSGGTILLFLRSLALGDDAVLSSIGGHASLNGGGGGGGGRIHFHWSDIPTGDVYQPIASVKGSIHARFEKHIHLVFLKVLMNIVALLFIIVGRLRNILVGLSCTNTIYQGSHIICYSSFELKCYVNGHCLVVLIRKVHLLTDFESL